MAFVLYADADMYPARQEATIDGGTSSLSTRDELWWGFVPFVVTIALTWSASVDDSFITLRYAANVVNGHGLVFNPGTPVQGFTSPLHLLVAIVAYALPTSLALFKLKLFSLFFAALTVHQAAQLLRCLDLPRWTARIAMAACGANWMLAVAGGNALETSLLMWCIMVSATCLIRRQGRDVLWASLASAAAVIARLDATVLVVAMGAMALLLAPREQRRRFLGPVAAPIAAALTTVVAATAIFGSPFPSTYYAKKHGLWSSLRLGWHYFWHLGGVVHTADINGWWLVKIQIFLAVALVLSVIVSRRDAIVLILATAAVTQYAVAIYVGGDWMVGGRFVAPVALLAISATVRSASHGSWPSFLPRPRFAGVVTLTLLAASFLPVAANLHPVTKIHGVNDAQLLEVGGHRFFSHWWVELERATRCLPPHRVVATSEVGYLGFERLDLTIVDVRGLNDMAIAKSALSRYKSFFGVADPFWSFPRDAVGRVLIARHPDLIIEIDGWPFTHALGGTYRRIRSVGSGGPLYNFYVPVHAPAPRCVMNYHFRRAQ